MFDDETETAALANAQNFIEKRAKKASGKPVVKFVVSDRTAAIDAAEELLAASGRVYIRCGSLVHTIHDHTGKDWIKRPDGEQVIREIKLERLQELLGQMADWKVRNEKGEWRKTSPPMWIVKGLEARGEWKLLPVLDGIADAPTLRADGSILDKPGYDPRTRLIYDPGNEVFPTIADAPTSEDVKASLALLCDLFVDFPFELGSVGLGCALSCLFSMFSRAAIDGCVPMFYAGAPDAGTGKGLLLDVCCMIWLGRCPAKLMHTPSEEETKARLFSLVRQGDRYIYIDNVVGGIGSGALANVLTSRLLVDRVKGFSESDTAAIDQIFMVTGNNLMFREDLHRRVIPIILNANRENPEDRDGWRHPELLDYVRDNRPALVTAVLTILRAYVVAGKPSHGKSRMGSYEQWDDLVRGSVVWAHGADPYDAVRKIKETANPERETLRSVLTAWYSHFALREVRTSDLIHQMSEPLIAACGNVNGQINAQIVGKYLEKHSKRVVGELLIDRAKTPDGKRKDKDGSALWNLRVAESESESGKGS
jgi:putative DNA primase/helicase